MRILNLYAGIGGNRKLWGDTHEITAVEYKPEIADIYHDLFPNDKVVIADAHQYLLKHYKEFDFIWSSPPCPTHSKARFSYAATTNEHGNARPSPIYPDMRLWQEIVFLKYWFHGKFCVENVIPYYELFYNPSIAPMKFAGHCFWTNFVLPPFDDIHNYSRAHTGNVEELAAAKGGFDLSKYKIANKRLLLRNCVEPNVAKHILDWSQKEWHHTKSLLQESNPK